MNIILLILSIILLVILIISRRETFKSVNSDFIKRTGQTSYEHIALNNLIKKYQKQINDIPQTHKKIPGTSGHTVSIGWEPLFIPEDKTEKEVRDNLSNMKTDSFLKVLGWEKFYEPTEAEIKIIKDFMKLLLDNIVKKDDEVFIDKLVKHEDNYFTFLCYLVDPNYEMYYAQVNCRVQIQNNTIIIHNLKFEGLITPFSVMHIESSIFNNSIKNNYGERERREQKFISNEELDKKVKDFETRNDEIMLRMNAHIAGAPIAGESVNIE